MAVKTRNLKTVHGHGLKEIMFETETFILIPATDPKAQTNYTRGFVAYLFLTPWWWVRAVMGRAVTAERR